MVKADGSEVLLIKPHNRDRWQLPKGTIDSGESSPVTAVREVREETGVDAEILSALAPIRFFYQMHGQKFVKIVDFYLMRYVAGSPDDHDDEVDKAKWFPAQKALKKLTFDSEREVVRQGLGLLASAASSAAS